MKKIKFTKKEIDALRAFIDAVEGVEWETRAAELNNFYSACSKIFEEGENKNEKILQF